MMNWQYCTLVVTQTMDRRKLAVSILTPDGAECGPLLGTTQLGPALARLGAEGWEMCGCHSVMLTDGVGQQFYFKRPLLNITTDRA